MQTSNPISLEYKLGFHDKLNYHQVVDKGLSERTILAISNLKSEPEWMRDFRLRALQIFLTKPLPLWGGDLSKINFAAMTYYLSPAEKKVNLWRDLPKEIRNTYDKIGIPQAEKDLLAGVEAQYDSNVIYGSIKKKLTEQGVIFTDTDTALKKYPELFKEYFGKIIPAADNKFSALNSACWSGGSFIYVPKNAKVALPLQAYFRINAREMGQFERTLIIADEGSSVRYLEGCSATVYSKDSLHAAVVEIFVKKNAFVQYTTIQNWSSNVYNLVTKRARVEEGGTMSWIDCNIGCLSNKTRLFVCESGYKYINEIKTGEHVYSVDLNTLLPIKKRVLAVKNTGKRETFKLITENHREIEATGNHPFLSLERTRLGRLTRLNWKPLCNLKVGDYIALMRGCPDDGKPFVFKFELKIKNEKTLKNKVLVPQTSTDSLMWLFGLYIGDGYMERELGKEPYRVYFAVPKTDRAYGKLIKVIPSVFGCKYKHKGICVTINSVVVAQFFEQAGLSGTARTKRIPKWIFTLPASQKLAFIKGYFDADGCLRRNLQKNGEQYGQITFTSVNINLLEDLKLLMINCGLNPLKIFTYVRDRKLTLGKVVKEYVTSFLTANIKDSLKPILDSSFVPPQIEFARISSLKKIGKQEVFDLEVEGTHNFIVNGIIVHNSKITMKYPSCYLMGKGAKGETLSLAIAGKNQHQDTGAKMIHAAPETTSTIISKSISFSGGQTSYRGLLQVTKNAKGAKSKVKCDALILDPKSRSDTYPTMKVDTADATVEHEATVSKIGEEQLFYLQSRGLKLDQAESLIVNGFAEPIVKLLPMEYALELNRLIQLEMEGSVG